MAQPGDAPQHGEADPIKLAREALAMLQVMLEDNPQYAPVPGDAELDEMVRDLSHTGDLSMLYRCAIADTLSTLRARLAEVEGALRWAHDTLWEINPSNYNHDDVCKINDASVEVILGIAPLIGETHGKSPEWWAAHRKLKEGK